ncbi:MULTISPECIES: AraC family transcriptional regulator [unclassified Rhizobium]|uniref:helix-turn-helix domain-containing protein n=1 Tax=unclassified Rhizobium TaxID=2613769 RepID=UPI000E77197A|nr:MULTISPECIES: AraC family transcriptional regulator [unclassified Rhizobium]MBN8954974.1 helix-turn-helix transcriptional regulator [Rhizobium tropici]
MSFSQSMIWRTEGIRPTAPVRWRPLDGILGAFWQAESESGAKGYYLAAHPHIMIFFNDMSPQFRVSNDDGQFSQRYRPMSRAIYVPAGMPMWTGSNVAHRFSHLNLHIHRDRLLRVLSPAMGSSAALAAMRLPVEVHDVGPVDTLAGLLVEELSNPTRHEFYAESLVGSIVAGLFDFPKERDGQASGRLTQAQMNKLVSRVDDLRDHRLTVAEMARIVGLSESWFSNVFKQTTGKTPLQWQLAKRIDHAKKLLVESNMTIAAVAAEIGFSDQAHFTRMFRQIAGDTPAAWRRLQQIL